MRLVPRNDIFNSLDFFDDTLFNNNIMKADIYEKDDNYTIEIDLPGLQKENINIDYNNGYLIISAIKESISEDNKKYIKKEKIYGKYTRSFYIGEYNEDDIKASYNHGMLIINYPKEKQKDTKKQINID